MTQSSFSELLTKADVITDVIKNGIDSSNRTFWVGILVTIFGWVVVSLFSIKVARFTQKQATEHQARVDVYRQLYKLKQQVDTATLRLYGSLEPEVMHSRSLITQATDKTYLKPWNEYINIISEARAEYSAASQEYRGYIDAWLHLFPKVEHPTEILFDEQIPPTEREVDKLWIDLLDLLGKDFSEWPMDEYKERAKKVRTSILKSMLALFGDHFNLTSNELFSGVDKKWRAKSRDARIEEDVEFDMLTLAGIKTVRGKRKKS